MIVRMALVLILVASTASAQPAARPPSDLKAVPPDRQVTSVSYCTGAYRLALKDGSTRTFREYDPAFKTDTGASGPPKGTAALLPKAALKARC